MGAFVLRRLAIAVPVLIGVTLLAYLLVDLAPGDPVTAMIDPITRAELGAEWVELRMEQLGLNEPAPVRYLLCAECGYMETYALDPSWAQEVAKKGRHIPARRQGA